MEDKDKAKIIVALMTREVEIACTNFINAKAELARAEMGESLWEKKEDRRGGIGFSRCPYNVDLRRESVERERKEKLAREKVLAYAIDVFLDKI